MDVDKTVMLWIVAFALVGLGFVFGGSAGGSATLILLAGLVALYAVLWGAEKILQALGYRAKR